MSAPVDVLAVLRYNAKEATKKWGPDNQDAATLAAVAELIEASKKLHIVTAGISQNVDANERAALESALARVKGGAA
jgi:hypothetical protein